MRKFIYQSVVEQLLTLKNAEDAPVIKHFDVWNNNLTYIPKNEAFYTPAVFVEFERIDWRHQGRGVRDATVTVILHVVSQRNSPTSYELEYATDALLFFDILTRINDCLHGHVKRENRFEHDAITSIYSITDHDFEELRHDIEAFACHGLIMPN